ncbi:MAG: DNA helicase UvrD [Candidatus Edwardsbacteria bacterium RIFOXYD12_FULL_50_11]|uniref:DNA helicase UvrD n=1 Tax=Candidatus Edwardsbacteria bacterium GWF2_54_11 TaxID=1817851 RepID=A0A1F5RFC9_9BACT|nr:MAG: DNA helicase UvrD [Candidatus Edwardsbacteria bacterium RifOxyC12_full_54_24]OGF07073.1 MAG: DNA helicase UvrD [Candidatus Edwardsbacteria bacterium RifOxyA12_full_54_48]OGF10962.1 MAG: DNA helicase UvrD [Candidatus Edwardsbacteria bacterium GWE2_54_12]OGF13150.1 MAG: DNA helicase UvrD [Candidatus Edwardsbacteria bacterium GWF2_54_11]OGF15907.1 MAG: DNA helicase UvrD [Candidatus Edwardsbacteria bacterium RIFOXYD12_FULL_50_11]OGJ17456.1 MAG: DNA helicase UvrD [Candidatus Edwardsbacteria
MRFIADLHIHSKYSRATSQDMDLEHITEWAQYKGLGLLGSGDFTHPDWLKELRFKLESKDNGIYHYRGVDFMLTAEVCNLFTKDGKSRKIHNMIFAPSFEVVEQINRQLKRHADLSMDGRPIVNLYASRLVELVMGISPDCLVIPAHIWTPHFSLFGANFGFNSLEECYEDQAENIHVLETGLSSDPAMNWRLSELDRHSLISNSDAHSPSKLGREANVFDCDMDYKTICQALKRQDISRLLYTIEYLPEEGKYFHDGHRKCLSRLTPKEARDGGNDCPVCGKKLTIGVMHRIEELSDRPPGIKPANAIPFRHLVPLEEIIAMAFGLGTGTQTVLHEYHQLVKAFGNEFTVLLEATKAELNEVTNNKVADGIVRVRQGKVTITPGYDGEYGKLNIFDGDRRQSHKTNEPEEQLEIF